MAQNTLNLPIMLLKEARDDKWMAQLSVFLRLKSIYTNSVYYNHSLKKLSKILHIPVPTLSRYIIFLKAKGLLSKHSGNLCCLGNDKIKSRYEKGSFSLPIPIDNENQQLILQTAIIGLNLKDQQYHIDKSVSEKYSKKNKIYKTFEKRYDNTRKYTGLSITGISRLLNISRCTAQVYKKSATSLGYMVAKTKRLVLFTGVNIECFYNIKKVLQDYSSYSSSIYYFRNTGSVIQRLHDELHIRLFTIAPPLL